MRTPPVEANTSWSTFGRYALYNDGGQFRLSTPGGQGLLLRPLLTQLPGQQL